MPRDEVGVKVRENHLLDPEPETGRVGEVVVDVAPGIDHGRHARALVADQVRRLRQAAQVVLLEDHGGTLQRNVHATFTAALAVMQRFCSRSLANRPRP
jgi:hypothetical protein